MFTIEDFIENEVCELEEAEKIINSRFFRMNKKWISFSHSYMHIYLAIMYLKALDDEEKEQVYDNIIGDWPFSQNVEHFNFTFIFECAAYLDVEAFKKHYVKSNLKLFLSKIDDSDNRSICKSIFQYFHFDIRLNKFSYSNLKRYEVTYINPSFFNFLENIFGDFLCSVFHNITKDEFKSLKQFKEITRKEKNSKIKYIFEFEKLIMNDEFYNLMEEYGIIDRIINYYTYLKRLLDEIDNKNFQSIEDYSKLINFHFQN